MRVHCGVRVDIRGGPRDQNVPKRQNSDTDRKQQEQNPSVRTPYRTTRKNFQGDSLGMECKHRTPEMRLWKDLRSQRYISEAIIVVCIPLGSKKLGSEFIPGDFPHP